MPGPVILLAAAFLQLQSCWCLTVEQRTDRLLAFWNCIERNVENEAKLENPGVYCPATSDGLFCWDLTPAGQEAKLPCPHSMEGPGYVTRRCLLTGEWEVNNVTGKNVMEFISCPEDHLTEEPLEALLDDLSHVEPLTFANRGAGRAYHDCVLDVLASANKHTSADSGHCRHTFDGWGCWNDTAPGALAYVPCPTFILGFSPNKFAYRKCNADGTWFRHPDTNRTWSNYTTCVDTEDLLFRQQICNLYIVGYSVSVVALSVSLFLFCYFRAMNCTRVTIHKNLFASFVINNVMWIIWYSEVVQKPHVPLANELPCQILHVLVHYFLVSNYLWMFCEGLYLHTLMVVAFVKEDRILRYFFLLGWGLPFVLITVYAAARGTHKEHTKFCWLEDSIYQWILSGPVIVSMMINFIFLINIVHVLVTKLRAPNSPDNHQTRKAVRATLILIPLLGLQYGVTPFRPEPKAPGETFYEIVSAVVTSFQGLCVSLLFCFFNGEVIALVKKKFNWQHNKAERSATYCANTTVCCDMQEVTAV